VGDELLGRAQPHADLLAPGRERTVRGHRLVLGSSAEGDGTAHLGGHIANSSSDSFTITDAFAQNESGYPNGDHFYTPDLPGQAPGEVGGPLAFNFKNGRAGSDGEVLVSGFLYLKR
jgi:hypothetical protein